MQIALTTTGRRTGRPREVTSPDATVKLGPQVRPMVAHEVTDVDRGRLWALVCREFPLYDTYQRRTKRTIPLFVLEAAA